MPVEETLLLTRTHPKVLFVPLAVQIALIALHVLAAMFWPAETGWPLFDEWGALIAHGAILLVALIYAVIPLLRWWNTVFTVTDRRVEVRWGILYKNTREMPLDRIVSVVTERGILDRLFGCGTLVFHDAASVSAQPPTNALTERNGGNSMIGVRFHDVPRYQQVRALVEQARFPDAAHPQ